MVVFAVWLRYGSCFGILVLLAGDCGCEVAGCYACCFAGWRSLGLLLVASFCLFCCFCCGSVFSLGFGVIGDLRFVVVVRFGWLLPSD